MNCTNLQYMTSKGVSFVVFCTLVRIAAALVIGCMAGHIPQLREEVLAAQDEKMLEEGLHLTSLQPDKLEGIYKNDNDVYFLSEVKGDSRLLLITTLQGEVLYRATSPHNKDILVSLMGNSFLVASSHSKYGRSSTEGYLVPTASVQAVEEALIAGEDAHMIMASYAYASDDENQLSSVIQDSYTSFAERDEVIDFIEATKVLGRDMKVMGRDNPAAMSLYVMAMRLAKGSDKYAQFNAKKEHMSKLVYYQQDCPAPATICSNNKVCCKTCPIGNGCLGLCGTHCDCWNWACGNCCYNQGCYDHDLCCQKGYFNLDCLAVWKFKCSSYKC